MKKKCDCLTEFYTDVNIDIIQSNIELNFTFVTFLKGPQEISK